MIPNVGWQRRAVWPMAVLVAAGACSVTPPRDPTATARAGTIRVVAAENFWGSLAAQLGGDRVRVSSLVSSPNVDPHDYEVSSRDARLLADADYVIVNGAGYDTWASESIVDGPPRSHRVLDVGRLLSLARGANPHRWYFPGDVARVMQRISEDYGRMDPAHAGYFGAQLRRVTTVNFTPYVDQLASIKQRFAGTPVAASESFFVGIAQATALDLKTPASFLAAVGEGVDPTAKDKATVDAQIASKAVRVFVYNEQNATPDVTAIVRAARANGIEVVTMSETIAPPTALFEEWQAAQLQRLADALARATGR